MKKILLILPLILLSACDSTLVEKKRQLDRFITEKYYKALGEELPEEAVAVPQSLRYCYKLLGGVTCYNEPQTHLSTVLVAPPQANHKPVPVKPKKIERPVAKVLDEVAEEDYLDVISQSESYPSSLGRNRKRAASSGPKTLIQRYD
jgi:hypothetical protein